MTLKYNSNYKPHPSFRFEKNVMLGKVEMHGGVSFGFSSYMNSGFIRSNVCVGRYCSIGRNVTLGSGAHDFHAASTSPFFKYNTNPPTLKFSDEVRRLRVVIENDVWIGDNAYIMSGVQVGNGAIVSAGAIVTKDIPPYSIYAGVPARFISSRFEDDIKGLLLDSKFWELKPELIENLDIADLETFLEVVQKLKSNSENYFSLQYNNLNNI